MNLKLFCCFATLGSLISPSTEDSVISGYGPVNLNDLHPFTLSWNQVHYLVRDSLYEIEELAEVHDAFYKELHDCFGLENCIKQANILGQPLQSGREMGAGAFLQSIRRQRIEELSGQHSRITGEINQLEDHLRHRQHEIRRKQEQQRGNQNQGQQRQQGGQGQQRKQSSSTSSSSSFRSSRPSSGSSTFSNSSSWHSSSTSYGRSGNNPPPRSRVIVEYDEDDDGPAPNRG